MKQKIEQKLGQHLSLSMNQVISLGLHYLQMDHFQLEKELLEESSSNPYLEIKYPKKASIYYPRFSSGQNLEYQDDLSLSDYITVSQDTLADLKEEILYMELSALEKWLAEIIVSSIDEKGALSVSLDHIAHYAKTPLETVKKVFSRLQEAIPFLHLPQEDFLTRYFENIFKGNPQALQIAYTVLQIAKNGLNGQKIDLGSKKALFDQIVKVNPKITYQMLEKDFSELKEQFRLVMNMVASIKDIEQKAVHVLKPDIIVELNRHTMELNAKVFEELVPILSLKDELSKTLTKEEKSQLLKAKMIVNAVEKRQFSMALFVEKVFQKQWKYFFKGSKAKVPLSMKEAANDLGVHVSTISRLVKNKYYYLEGEIKPLKDIFERGVSTRNKKVAKSVVLESIQKILSLQPEYGKITDQAIKEILEKKGIFLSRRAVNKYRHLLLKGSSYENF